MKTKLQSAMYLSSLLICIFFAGLQPAAGQVAQFNFPATNSLMVSVKDPNVSVTNVSLSAGTFSASETNVTTGTYFPNEPYIEESTGWNSATQAAAKAFQFTITAAPGYTFSITNISFRTYASAAGPSAVGFAINSTDIYSANQPEALVFTNQAVTGQTGLSSALISIKGWLNGSRSSAGGGAFRLDDIIVTGTVTAANAAPVASAVGIGGITEVGEILSGSYTYSDTDGDAEGTSTYRWTRAENGAGLNEIEIPGANSENYLLTSEDVNKYIRFGVTPNALAGTSPGTESYSAYLGPVSTGADALSTITVDGTFTPASNINYINSQGSDVLLSSHAFARLSINDISGTPDDGLPTTLTGLTFSLTGSANLERVALYDSNDIEVAEVTAGPTVTFTGLALEAASGTSELFTIRGTFNAAVTDNAQPQFTVTNATVDPSGSFFSTPAAGGVSSSVSADENRIEVSASELQFIQQPGTVVVNGNQVITVGAFDSNSNLDTDFNALVTLTSNGFLTLPQAETAVAGIATFDDVNHNQADPTVILLAASVGLTPASSVEFAVVVQAAGLLLSEENFLYSGALNANGYNVLSGAGSNVLTPSAGNLTLANYGSTGIGNQLTLATSGEDVSRSFAAQSGSVVVYASMLLNVANASATGDYFFAFAPSALATNYRARLFVRSTTAGFVNFGISNAGSPVAYGSTNYPINVMHNVVVKYQTFSGLNAIATVFVNPNLYTEPASGETFITDAVIANIPADISSYTIRQGTVATAPLLTIDGIRVATNWGSALGNPQYDADGDINAGNYNSVMILDGTVTATGDVGINTSLIVESGTLDMNDKIIFPNSGAILNIDGALSTAKPDGLVGIGTTTIDTGNPYTFNADGTIIYNANVPQQISSIEYGTLELQGMGAKEFQGDTTVTGNLLHNSSGDVSVPTGIDLAVAGQLISTGEGEFILENDANLIQEGSVNTNIGPITVKRNAYMRRLDYVYWSSPVSGQQLQSFSPTTLSNRFYEINEGTNAFAPVNAASDFAAAKGYAVRAPNEYLEAPAASQLFEGSFSGLPNSGEYSIAVTNTPVTGMGYNLIGNPYPSAVDAQAFLDGNDHIGTLYFWTHQNQDGDGVNYASFNGTGAIAPLNTGEIPNGTIQTGQGFVVHAASSANAVFTNEMRSRDNSGQFFRNSPLEKHRIWLNLSNSGNALNQLLIGYIENATNGHDIKYDGHMIEQTGSRLSTIINNTEFSIEGRALPFTVSDVVQLGFTATEPDNYTIAIDHMDGLFTDSQNIFVRDNLMGTIHNLGEAYSFASTSGTFNNRFELMFQNTTLGIDNPAIDNNNVMVYKQHGQLHVNTGGNFMDSVKVYDVRGQLIFENSAVNASATSFSVNATRQVLVVQVSANGKTVSKKVIF